MSRLGLQVPPKQPKLTLDLVHSPQPSWVTLRLSLSLPPPAPHLRPADQFPSLQSKMRVVLRVEVEAVKFLKEEPQRLDALLKRCNSVTDALSTLRRYQALLFPHIRFLNSVFTQFHVVFCSVESKQI